VDDIGVIKRIEKVGESIELEVEYPGKFEHYIVGKGSIAVNGVSLTVNKINRNRFTVNLIPYTQREITIDSLSPGSRVNLEFDILGKYAARMIGTGIKMKNHLTLDKMRQAGW
jgi:riboflavin synthase